MSVTRPTFHESWYRVTDVRPRLRTMAQTHRQHFRGRRWHVVEDPSNNRYFRLSESAYHFVSLLDGRRSVSEAWAICNEMFGDDAPTQGEVLNLLGQLYTANLLQSDLTPDAAGMFENQQRRVHREIGGYFRNLLFLRFPLLDPDAMLDRWERVLGFPFSRWGLMAWCVLLGIAAFMLIGRVGDFTDRATSVLAPGNLPLLYLSFAAIKALHELGHGIATKRIARIEGRGGAVHTVGIALLLLTPVPYVDASSSWAFLSKWNRAVVGAAGMYVELAVAAVATIVWAGTSPGLVHSIAYNMIFVASISTVLFNANPLLRFDGYYILSDLLEVPNLAQRSRDYLMYLARRHLYGLANAVPPPLSGMEQLWFPLYGLASVAFRVFICVGIVLFLSEQFFIIGTILAVATVAGWIVVPIGRLTRFLLTDPSLARGRARAIAATAVILLAAVGSVALVPVPDRARAEGIVEPALLANVYSEVDGFIDASLPTGVNVSPDGAALVQAHNRDLESERDRLLAEQRLAEAERDQAEVSEFALAQSLGERIEALTQQVEHVEERLASLNVHAPFAGQWIAPDLYERRGAYMRRGELLGHVATVDELLVRAVADQGLGPRIEPEIGLDATVELRVRGRPDLPLRGRVRAVRPAGEQRLPSAALGYRAGGAVRVHDDDSTGTLATEPFFETVITLDPDDAREARLHGGQRVIVRFEMPPRPLLAQWWRAARRLVQRRFET